ncbi:MAG: modification methylase, partial [Deltaproteobacteria bacterium]|nr:modification methylase [Deltaproteobacteria bacterium]
METPPANRLYYGDNLAVLRDAISSESVDLIYLDPPFNSNANYNVLFSESPSGGGGRSRSQVLAFEDTWHWGNESERAYAEILKSGNTQVSEM